MTAPGSPFDSDRRDLRISTEGQVRGHAARWPVGLALCLFGSTIAALGSLCTGGAVQAVSATADLRDPVAPSQASQQQADAGAGRSADAAPGRVTISGKCFDDAGRPFERATVALYRLHPDYPAPPERLHEVQTDAEGAYRFPDLEPPPVDSALDPWKYAVIATARGRGTRVIRLPVPARGEIADLVLPPARTLSGSVSDNNGQPVEGADVWIGTIGNKALDGPLSTKTDHEGNFAITDLVPAGFGRRTGETSNMAMTLYVRHPDHVRHQRGYKDFPDNVHITLQPAGTITGRVIDDATGLPAAGVVVSIQGIRDSNSRVIDRTLTDDRGAYRFTSMRQAGYNVWASADERTCAALELVPVYATLTNDVEDLHLVEGGWIEGRVTTIDNRPITAGREPGSRVRIGLYGPSRPRSNPTSESCVVDDDGRFRLRVAPGRNFPFIMTEDLWERTWRRDKYENGVDVQSGQTLTVNFRILDKKPPPPRPKRDPVVLPLPVEDERRAANEIRDLGGWYGLDDEQHVVEVNMVYHNDNGKRYDNGYTESDEALYTVHAFPRLKRLFLCKGQATDEALQGIDRLTGLQVFFAWDAIKLTDAGVKHLAGLEKLENIHINGSQIGDPSLEVLATLPELSKMSLQQNHFTNAGLAHLAGMQQLRSLWVGLGDGKITDAGLKHLTSLENLEELDIQNSQVTKDGVEALKEALPNLRVVHGRFK